MSPELPPRRWHGLAALAAGVATLAFVRLRGHWPAWVELHRFLDRHGVSPAVRNLDQTLFLVGVPLLAAALLARRRPATTLGLLGLRRPIVRPLLVALACALPMFLQGAMAGWPPRPRLELFLMAGTAPFVEELFFRGLCVALPVRAGGLPFVPVAVFAGLLFGAAHVPWTRDLAGGDVLVVGVTGAGGVFFAWLYRRWDWNLWMPIGLHAAMNLAWGLFAIGPNAVGDLPANLGRAATIALAVIVTRRRGAVRSSG